MIVKAMAELSSLSMTDKRAALASAINRVADGDRHALKVVYDLTAAKLLGVVMHIARDREQAEDILQEVFLKVWHRAGRFDGTQASPITWLCAIARNTAIDSVRKSGRRAQVGEDVLPDIEDEAPRADQMLCSEEDSELLQQCLERLQDDHRRSIRMAFFRGYSHSELAERVGVPLGTVKSWIRRGLASLKGCLGGA